MRAVPPWLHVALCELAAGVTEQAGGRHDQRILEYLATCRNLPADLRAQDETAWCAAFVNWCLRIAWRTPTWSARARSYETWGQEVSGLPLGAVIVLSRPPNPDHGHVGFLMAVQGDLLQILGGNQGNRVSIAPYPRARLVAARWPASFPLPPPAA